MESDNLVAENIGTWCQGLGNGNGPGVVIGDELIGGPGSGNDAIVDKSYSVDLEEFEGGFVDGCAVVTGACRKVV